MKQKELFYDDFKLKKPFGLHGLYKKSALQGLTVYSFECRMCNILVR